MYNLTEDVVSDKNKWRRDSIADPNLWDFVLLVVFWKIYLYNLDWKRWLNCSFIIYNSCFTICKGRVQGECWSFLFSKSSSSFFSPPFFWSGKADPLLSIFCYRMGLLYYDHFICEIFKCYIFCCIKSIFNMFDCFPSPISFKLHSIRFVEYWWRHKAMHDIHSYPLLRGWRWRKPEPNPIWKLI